MTPQSEETGGPRVRNAPGLEDFINTEVLCRECGYCLRGLSPYGLCPECATPVQVSLGGDELYRASLTWLRSLRRGFWWMKLALAVWLLILVGVAVGTMLSKPSSWLGDALVMAAGLALPAALIVAAAGFILATRPEPLVRALGEGLSARRLSRYLAALAALLWGITQFMAAIVPSSAIVDVLMMVLPHCASLAGLAAAIAFARYVSRVLKRTPATKSVKSAEQIVTVASVAVLFIALGIVGQAALPLIETKAPRLAEALGNLVRLTRISSCCVLIVVLGLLSLVWQVSGVLGHTLAQAEEHAHELEKNGKSDPQ